MRGSTVMGKTTQGDMENSPTLKLQVPFYIENLHARKVYVVLRVPNT